MEGEKKRQYNHDYYLKNKERILERQKETRKAKMESRMPEARETTEPTETGTGWDILKNLREGNGESSNSIGLQIGVSGSTILQWEQNFPKQIAILKSLCDYFGVTPNYLLGYETETKQHDSVYCFNGFADELDEWERKALADVFEKERDDIFVQISEKAIQGDEKAIVELMGKLKKANAKRSHLLGIFGIKEKSDEPID